MYKKTLQRIRRVLAAIFFLGITLMFLDFSGTLHKFLGWMAKMQFLPAVLALNFVVIAILLIITLLFGRIYCSVICPLGVFQDGVAHLHNKFKKNRYTYSKAHNILRYIILGIFIVALIAGLSSLVALLAPYSAYGRIVQNLFAPIWQWINNGLAAISKHYNNYAFYNKEVWMRSLPTFIIAAVTFVVVVILAWRNGRTYCNNICPVGTFLSFFSRFSWFKMHINEEKCVHCGACAKNCKASCIDSENRTIDYSRCIVCGDCMALCPAFEYKHGKGNPAPVGANNQSSQPGDNETEKETVDTGKRAFLIGSAVAIGAAAFAQEKKKVDGGLAAIKDKVVPERKTPIVPAGAGSLNRFRQHCTGCQLCVSQCPNDVLRPSTDLMHLMQPEMSFERGYCRPECTACSDVCPTGAIQKLLKEEKAVTKKGQAYWVSQNCIVMANGIPCGNCARHCPAEAIEMIPMRGDDTGKLFIPAVNESKCIGCGACEYLCPARPLSAIIVEGVEQQRTI
ncbi:MAG: 4Fe-4S binding protein [Bacteroidales bacterium]|nr:4Fe-4S binding protein [Bacteroidales bacterium]